MFSKNQRQLQSTVEGTFSSNIQLIFISSIFLLFLPHLQYTFKTTLIAIYFIYLCNIKLNKSRILNSFKLIVTHFAFILKAKVLIFSLTIKIYLCWYKFELQSELKEVVSLFYFSSFSISFEVLFDIILS
jgi:hypothetical protein